MSPHATTTVPIGTNNWWKEATVYQVLSLDEYS
jgi:alpha-glucosidase